MRLKFLASFLVLQLAIIGVASAQTNEFTGWAAWFHTQRLSKNWGVSFDAQVRSAKDLDYVRNVLLRPNVNYYFGGNKSATLGYAYVSANSKNIAGDIVTRHENRIFEQFIINQKAGTNSTIQHRFRLEQRFLGSTATQPDVFSQRARYFIRGIIPLNKQAPFTNGMFLALQNEAFANVQNKDKLSGKFFDQNRAYVAIGHRLNKGMDIEAGYMNQYLNQAGKAYTFNHIAQIALYTRFGQ